MIKKLVFNIPFILFLIITISSCEKNDNNQLKKYVHKKDSAFKYEIVETFSADTWKEYKIKMVSGTWFNRTSEPLVASCFTHQFITERGLSRTDHIQGLL